MNNDEIKKQRDKIRLNCELPTTVMIKITPVYNPELLNDIKRAGRENFYILQKTLENEQIHL